MADRGRAKGGGAQGKSHRMSALLINALNHPLRRKILRALHGATTPVARLN